MSHISQKPTLRTSQSGVVAIIATMIMIMVIGLLVVGFTQVSRRTQRSTLDSQLSAQAYYAAESGVNDAVAKIKAQLGVGAVTAKPTCADVGIYNFDSFPSVSNPMSTLGSGVSYSCVLIDPNPSKVNFTLGEGGDTVVKLKTLSGQPFTQITYSWVPAPGQESQPKANCPTGAGQYEVADSWNCKFAVLRSELAPTVTLNRNNLIDATHVNFFGPMRSATAGTSTWSTDNAKSIAANCTEAACTATINFGGAGVNTYYLHVGALYRPTTLTISGTDTAGPVKFAEVQAQISVTGKAQDVLRRVLVAVSIDGQSSSAPSGAIVSGDTVCKRFSVTAGSFNTEGFPGANNNPLCQDDVDQGTPTP